MSTAKLLLSINTCTLALLLWGYEPAYSEPVTSTEALVEAVRDGGEGSTIEIGAGTFELAGPLELKTGMTLKGAGMDETILTHTAGWKPSTKSLPDPEVKLQGLDADAYLIRLQDKAAGITISHLTLRGPQVHGAIFGFANEKVHLHHLRTEDVRWSGIRTFKMTESRIHDCEFIDAGGKWKRGGIPGENGGISGGAIFVTWMKDTEIAHNRITRTNDDKARGHFGIKGRQGKRCRIHHNTIEVNFSIEFPFENDEDMEIDHNVLHGVVSIPKYAGGATPKSGRTFHIHHNYFTTSYAIEFVRNGVEIDHNLFDFDVKQDGGNLISAFGRAPAPGPAVIHNNLVSNPGRGVIWINEPYDNLVIRNNHIVTRTTATPRKDGLFGFNAKSDFSTIKIIDNVIECKGQPRPLLRNDESAGAVIRNNRLTNVSDTGRYKNPATDAKAGLEHPLKFQCGVHGELTIDGWKTRPTAKDGDEGSACSVKLNSQAIAHATDGDVEAPRGNVGLQDAGGSLERRNVHVKALDETLPNVPSEQGKRMRYEPYVCHSLAFGRVKNSNQAIHENAVPRALVVSLPADVAVCYDVDRGALAGLWRHDGESPNAFVNLGRTHHQSGKGGSPALAAGDVLVKDLKTPGWLTDDDKPLGADALNFRGHYLHGDRVVLRYRVRGRDVIETPGLVVRDGKHIVTRTFHIGAGEKPLRVVLLSGAQDNAKLSVNDDAVALTNQDGRTVAVIPASDKPRVFTAAMSFDGADVSGALASKAFDPIELTRGGPARWGKTVVTQGLAAPDKQAYVLDTLTVPHENPWGCWMRLSAIDFLSDGTAVVSTLSGDVWLVRWNDDNIGELRWRRFATGLYEPLGLKVVDDRIYVRGRDRITRLHDLNGDGEADYYENFHSAGDIGTSYHAFLFDLVTDKAGNFYFARSGRKAPPPGDVVRVSHDGTKREVIATHFRHPNGMGGAGLHDWILIADNPGGKYPSGAMLVRQGASYGHEGPRTAPYLFVLPPEVDTSSGSQCWTDSKRFGPLSNTLIHTSYSKSTACYAMVQAFGEKRDPNGFAVKLPFQFRSGVMRCRVSPRDGQVYIVGQRGWDTNAATDGCLQRVRFTGKPAYVVESAEAIGNAVQLRFSTKLDAETVETDGFAAARVSGKQKQDVAIKRVSLIDARTVRVEFAELPDSAAIDRSRTEKAKDGRTHYRVVPPLAISFDLDAADGTLIRDTVYATINSVKPSDD